MNDDDEKELRKIIIRVQGKQYDDEETLSTVADRAYELGRDAGQCEAASLRYAALGPEPVVHVPDGEAGK